MAYSDFDLPRVHLDLGLTVVTVPDLFGSVPPVPVDPHPAATLRENRGLAITINTEKARSQLLIPPLVTAVWRSAKDRVAVFSGVPLSGPGWPGWSGCVISSWADRRN